MAYDAPQPLLVRPRRARPRPAPAAPRPRSTRCSSRSTPARARAKPRRGRACSSARCTGRSAGRPRRSAARPRRPPRLPRLSLRARRPLPRGGGEGQLRGPRSPSSRRPSTGSALPQYVAQLGDLYRVTGKEKLARREYALIGVIDRLLNANGVKTDLEIALFDVDHGIDPPHALALARIAHRDRPSIDGDDALAWALAHTGHCARGAAVREPRAAARHARLPEALPSGMDRAVPRAARRGAARLHPCAGAQPALLDPVGPRRQKGTPMKRLVVLAGLLAALLAPAAASAHPLGNFTVNRFSRPRRGLRAPALREIRARHGRDPDLPGRPHRRRRLREADRRQRASDRERQARDARPAAARAGPSPRRRRPAHDAARGACSAAPSRIEAEHVRLRRP